ncbi:transposase [Methyloversatilis sp.]|uniref:transposase n=1 Tax=Methyloversatilis sp. TaxID=2569862 RepID=UPI0035B0BA98
MPRRARLSLPGVPLHLVQRGNNRQACFFAPDDYRHYLDWLEDHSRRQGCRVHAYVLMTNHVHLLVSADDPGAPSRVMKALGQRYVQYINRTYRRSGGLWEGRFRSCLVQQDDYLFACLRYIEMNPVRAGMVEQPADYRWSSYRAHAHGAFDTMLTPHAAYLALGTNPDERQQRYRMLFREQLGQQVLEDIRDATRGNFVLGNPKFAAEVAVALGRRASRGKAGRPRQIKPVQSGDLF